MTQDSPLTPSLAPLLDETYLNATLERLDNVLSDAHSKVSYFCRDIEALAKEERLPSAYRAAYQDVVNLLTQVSENITSARQHQLLGKSFSAAEESVEKGDRAWPDDPSTEWIEAAKKVINEINAAELAMVQEVEGARKIILEQQPQSLIDWTMPFDYEMTVILEPGPSRAFYQDCGDGEEPFRIPVGLYIPDIPDESKKASNWNIFRNCEGHPLRDGHHGYLVHCLLDHNVIPWQLLPCLKEIEVNFQFVDFESAWLAKEEEAKG